MLIQLQAWPAVKITGGAVFRSRRVAIPVSAERGDEAIAWASVGVFTNARIAHAVAAIAAGQTIRRTDRTGLADQGVTNPVATEASARAVHGAARRVFADLRVAHAVTTRDIARAVRGAGRCIFTEERIADAISTDAGRRALRIHFELAQTVHIAEIERTRIEIIAVEIIEAAAALTTVGISVMRTPAKVAEVVGTRIEIVAVEITGAAGELLTIGIRNGTHIHTNPILAASVAIAIRLRTSAAVTEAVAFAAIEELGTEVCICSAIRVWYVAREIAIPVAALAEHVGTVQILRDASKITEAVTA